MGHLIPS